MPKLKMKAKPSKAYIKNNCEGEYKDLLNSVKNGAKVGIRSFWNKDEYWIYYPKGGCHRISKTNFSKLSLITN